MHLKRLSQLNQSLRAHGLDVLALVPGPNLFYLTGLSFHLSERPIVALFPLDGSPTIVLPTLEAVKVEQTDVVMDTFPYTDEEGHISAFRQACDTLALSQSIVSAEALRMRLKEVQLLERRAPGCRVVAAEDALTELRVHKDEYEVKQMRRAIGITESALCATVEQVKAGMTEREVASLLRIELLREGGEAMAFAPIVVAGPNAASPHATPSDRPIQPGEPIIVDCGALVDGYMADITRTFVIGDLELELARVYEIVQAANRAGRAAVRPGTPAETVDQAARSVIEESGYGEYFIHRTGHGLGLEVHEPPFIVAGNEQALESGMTFTVEPGIYLPGRGGVRIEDDVLVTKEGVETLTTFTREILSLSR